MPAKLLSCLSPLQLGTYADTHSIVLVFSQRCLTPHPQSHQLWHGVSARNAPNYQPWCYPGIKSNSESVVARQRTGGEDCPIQSQLLLSNSWTTNSGLCFIRNHQATRQSREWIFPHNPSQNIKHRLTTSTTRTQQ